MKFLSLLLLFIFGCGGTAEARPYKGRIAFRLAVVDSVIDWNHATTAWAMANQELTRAVKGKVFFDMYWDANFVDDRPDLLTVPHFWDRTLFEHWMAKAPPARDGIRAVILPPLEGYLYGGMNQGRAKGGFLIANAQQSNPRRSAYVWLHEMGHLLGNCMDWCDPKRTKPDLMCSDDYGKFRDGLAPLVYTPLCTKKIRRMFGLRVGKKLVIRKRK